MRTIGSVGEQLRSRPARGYKMRRSSASVATLRILAVEEFCSLATHDERIAWAEAHGVTAGVITSQTIKAARGALKSRQDNDRLGLPDPLR